MYELTVMNHLGKEKTWHFIEYFYAEQMYKVAKKCIDCANVVLIDAMSGEVIVEWSYIHGEKHWNEREDIWDNENAEEENWHISENWE